MLEVSVRSRFQSASEVLRAMDVELHRHSLSQGMITQPKPVVEPEDRTVADSGPSSGMSPASRLAEEIRARKARAAATRLPSGGTRNRSVPPNRGATAVDGKAASGGKAKIPNHWDALSVKTAYTKGRRDFASCDLSLLDLSRTSLAAAIFHQANLTKTNFQNSDLSSANFGRANLNQASLRDANLSKAYMSYASLEGADLRGADLTEAYLSYANLRGANLCGANLTGARVTDEQLAMAKTNWLTVKPTGKRGLF